MSSKKEESIPRISWTGSYNSYFAPLIRREEEEDVVHLEISTIYEHPLPDVRPIISMFPSMNVDHWAWSAM